MLRVFALTTLFPSAARPHFAMFIENSFRALAARGDVELTIVAPVGLPPAPFDRHPRYHALRALPLHESFRGLDVHRPRFTLIPALGWRRNPARIARAAAPILHAAACDVIHAEFHFPDAAAAARLAREAELPMSVKALGSDVHLCGRRGAARRAMLAAAANAGGVLAVSESLRRDLIAMGVAQGSVRVHYTGVDLKLFAPADREAGKTAFGLDPNQPLVVSVGNLIPLKGHDIVVAAVARLPGVQLRIIGGGPERDRLGALIDRLGIADRAQLIGTRPHAEVAAWLAAADVMALASEREGLANAWVEALACGTPVITTPVGGAGEVIATRAAGRLAQRTPESFAAAIAETLAQQVPRSDTRATVTRFSWESHAAAFHAHLVGIARRGNG